MLGFLGVTVVADARSVWTLKGISPETREAVKIAARKRGVTIAAWVEDVCRRVATEEIKGSASLPGPTQETLMQRLLDLVEAQNGRLAALEAASRPTPVEQRSWLDRLFGRSSAS